MAWRSTREHHKVGRVGWLRAAVLGANDGLLSTASLIIGVASAPTSHEAILIAGVAGMIAGSMSMAAGEYVSVSSQHDAEKADLSREATELDEDPEGEEAELSGIYVKRGLDRTLASQVAKQLMSKDALNAHARDELGLSDVSKARPLQAAAASAASFAVGAAPPLVVAILVPQPYVIVAIGLTSLVVLGVLGGVGAGVGGAPVHTAVIRVIFWGALAMLVTAGIGHLFGTRTG
jgi:VIT1/CCC1 family predicted Fe2+/Mn2+ transporter